MGHISKLIACVSLLGTCIAILSISAALVSARESPDCKVVSEALNAANNLTVGMLRGDLHKTFEADGGISFPRSGTFTFRKCPYIKIDVEFDARDVEKNALEFSPKDPITRISKPYLGYPSRD